MKALGPLDRKDSATVLHGPQSSPTRSTGFSPKSAALSKVRSSGSSSICARIAHQDGALSCAAVFVAKQLRPRCQRVQAEVLRETRTGCVVAAGREILDRPERRLVVRETKRHDLHAEDR